jgi:hypothetical protein
MGAPIEFLALLPHRRIARVGFVVCAFALAATSVFAQGSGPGTLKVCKVAGPGVAVGTVFTFTAGSNTQIAVPAGPPPGGTCVVVPSPFPVGTNVPVVETPIPPGDTVSSITVAPPGQQVGSRNGGSVTVTIGSGVTEVTFTDKKTGFLEICKNLGSAVAGPFTFTITPANNPGNLNLGPFVVPAGACSPAIEVAAGSVTINELTPGTTMASCTTIPPANQVGPCSAQTDTVNVLPGDVSTMTIAFITNR